MRIHLMVPSLLSRKSVADHPSLSLLMYRKRLAWGWSSMRCSMMLLKGHAVCLPAFSLLMYRKRLASGRSKLSCNMTETATLTCFKTLGRRRHLKYMQYQRQGVGRAGLLRSLALRP
jgi:hypothetical protein